MTAGISPAASLRASRGRGSINHLAEMGNHRVGSGSSRDCPDLQRLPSRTRPGDRPPVSRFEIARLMWGCRRTGKAVRETGRPFSVFFFLRHSGMRPPGRRPGIHNPRSWLWIPGSREDARPGMTMTNLYARPGRADAPVRPGGFFVAISIIFEIVLTSSRLALMMV